MDPQVCTSCGRTLGFSYLSQVGRLYCNVQCLYDDDPVGREEERDSFIATLCAMGRSTVSLAVAFGLSRQRVVQIRQRMLAEGG